MLKKSTLREIRTSLARYLAIFSIVALGVGFFAGLRDCKASMVKTATDYLEEHNFYDYQIISSYGIDDESVRIAESDGQVSDAEGSVQIDVMASSGGGDEEALRAISLPENINTLRVVQGRLPENAQECVVDDYHYTDDGYRVGDHIVLTDSNDKDKLKDFKYTDFEIVGTVNTPVYLDYPRGSTDIGNGSLDTFFFVQRDAFDVDYFTSLYLTLKGDEMPFTAEMEQKIDETGDSMTDLAEKITANRRETAMKEALEELGEKEEEYEENLAKYEDEKADAEKKIKDAKNKIKKGEKKIASAKKQLNNGIKKADETIETLNKTIPDLESKKKEAEAGLAAAEEKKKEAEAGLAAAEEKKKELEQAHAAGMIDDDTYAAGTAQADAGIKQAKDGLAAIDAGAKQAKDGLAKIESGIKQAKDGLAEAKEGKTKAKAGLKALEKQKKKLDKNKKKVKKEEQKADEEFAKAKKELDDAWEKIEDAREEINEMETGNSYAFSREDNAGYSSFDSNSSIVSNIAKIFPVFFFLIAALVCMTTMTRMVDEQRTQIGVLKALGYSNGAIAGKYLFYSGSAAFMGAAVGFFAGCKIFPAVIWKAYTMMYDFSDTVDYIIDVKLGLLSLAAALLCSMGATWFSIAQDFSVSPSNLIRPKTPPAGKRILLERITPLWKRISFLYKVSFRNIFRDKKRFLMMVIGVSGCTALLIAGFGIRTTIARVADYQFDEISVYDINVVFSKNMNEKRQAGFAEHMAEKTGVTADNIFFHHSGEVSIISGGINTDVTCVAADPEHFGEYIDLHAGDEPVAFPGEGECVIVRKLNHEYGISPGDEITIRDGYRKMNVKVSAVCDNYVRDYIYMSADTYEKGFGAKANIKSAYIKMPEPQASDDPEADQSEEEKAIRAASAQAASYEHTAATVVSIDMKENVSKMMKSLDLIIYVVILSAALLAFIVLYNLTNINITERIREIATIKVLGFNQFEVSQYVFRENVFLTAIAAVVGIPAGKWLLSFVINNIVVKIIYFEPRLNRTDFVFAVILTFVFAGVVNLAMQRRLRNVSMTESLKSVE